MKALLIRLVAAVVLSCTVMLGGAALVSSSSCTPQQAQAIKKLEPALLMGKDLACLIMNIELGTDDAKALQLACGLADEYLPSVIDTLTAYKAGKAAARAGLSRDAGLTDAAKDR